MGMGDSLEMETSMGYGKRVSKTIMHKNVSSPRESYIHLYL